MNLSNRSWFLERDATVEFFKQLHLIPKPNKMAATSTADNSKTWQQITMYSTSGEKKKQIRDGVNIFNRGSVILLNFSLRERSKSAFQTTWNSRISALLLAKKQKNKKRNNWS